MEIDEIRQAAEKIADQEKAQYQPGNPPQPDKAGRTFIFNSSEIVDALFANQVGDARIYKRLHRGKFLYDFASQTWKRFDEHFWRNDTCAHSFTTMQSVVEAYRGECNRISYKINNKKADKSDKDEVDRLQKIEGLLRKRIDILQTKARIKDVLEIARAGPDGLGTDGQGWDCQKTLVAFLNGVLELDTGTFRAGRPDDMLTRHCDCEWSGPNIRAPSWEAFIFQIMAEDHSMCKFLQCLLGYCFSGLFMEKILPVLHGPQGNNGKTLLMETLKKILNSYADEIPSKTLLAIGKNESGSAATPDIMLLRGKNLCWGSETSTSQVMDLAKSKWLTGGDNVVGRHLHQEFVHFEPTAKIFLLTNNRPKVDGSDPAVWGRIVLIPFERSFVENPELPHERLADKNLKEKLLQEAPGIAAWLYRGFREWRRIGLQKPDKVRLETRAYRNENDSISQFLEESTIQTPGVRIRPAELFSSYEVFCNDAGLDAESGKAFFKTIKSRFQYERNHSGRWYLGLTLKAADETKSVSCHVG